MSETIILPRVYDDPEGNYPQHKGKPKLSYSQYTSWIDPKYHAGYRQSYFAGVKDDGNPFSKFGGQCGEWLETSGEKVGDMLSDGDIEVLESIKRHPDARYEVEIVVDRGWDVIQGFIDYEFLHENGLDVLDYKTGAIAKKADFYGSDEYQQTTLYSYQREKEGNRINSSGVLLLDRKGNTFQNIPLALTGEMLSIDTPYSVERAETFLEKVDVIALAISKAYEVYLKLEKIK